MFGKPKIKPGVPYEVQRVYDLLNPKPKELLQKAGGRRFVMEGEVGVFNHKERKTKRRYLFLFNDILLITKKEGKKSFWLKVFISLRSTLKVEDVPDSTTRYKVEFRIYAPKKTIILFTQSEEDKVRWLREIRNCCNRDAIGNNPNTYEANPVQEEPKEEPIKISGDIGKIEIPGVNDEDFGHIPDADEDSDEVKEDEEPVVISAPKEIYGDLAPTPNCTPVDNVFDEFDSLANRSAQAPPQQPAFDPFANSQPLAPLDPFASSVPLSATPVVPSSASILQPIPSNSSPAMTPTPTPGPAGFDALKSLDTQQQGNYYPQAQPPQMFSQGNMGAPPPYSMAMDPNLSIEEQMQRLSMNAPFGGN